MGEVEEKGGIERRREVRVPARLAVRYRLPGGDAAVERVTANVSYNGVFVVTGERPALGSELAFELATEEGELVLRGRGVVRWVRPTGSAAQPPGVGLMFTSLTDEERARMHGLVDRFIEQKLAGVEPVAPGLGLVPPAAPESLPWSAPAEPAPKARPKPTPTPPAPPEPPRIRGGRIVVGLLVALALAGLAFWAIFRTR